MPHPVLQLYPEPPVEVALNGLYLQHNLHRRGSTGKPFVYTNFVTSLDGRIAVGRPGSTTHQVPPAIANPRDWRLFQELATQSDVLITTARYFRQLAAGDAQDLLPLGREADYEDLHHWRRQEGLSPQPAVAILSTSLDLPGSALQRFRDRQVFVITGEAADPERRSHMEAQGIPVVSGGAGDRVTGPGLVNCLAQKGLRNAYAIGGPRVCHTLISGGVLNRLYLTCVHRIIGGRDYDTVVWGEVLEPPLDARLVQLCRDAHGPDGAHQFLSVYDLNY